MPYVMKNKESNEVFACTLINRYDYEYYGVKAWEDEQTAAEEYASFLLERGFDDIWLWEIAAIDEQQLRLGNVKLNNDPHKRLIWNEQGKWTVVRTS